MSGVASAAVRRDVDVLAGMVRGSASPGEHAAAQWAAGRLRESGVPDVALRHFRYQGTYGIAHALHAAAALRGGPFALAALASLELEASGRLQWLRRVLPGSRGSSVWARIPAGGAARHTLVLVAHLDTARTGLAWHPRIVEAGAARRLQRRRVDPFMAPTAAGMLLAALPSRAARTAGRALLAASIAADLDIVTSRHVAGASDNATGVAVVLALAEELAREPLEHVDVEILLPGCEESGMGGMADWLRARRDALDPRRTLVLGLDTLGAGTPIVLAGEGTILEHRYRDEDLELADEGARLAGVEPPQRWRIGGWTDPVLARFAGLPALSLLSIGPKGQFTNYHRPTDVPERVDWESVEACARLARGVAVAYGRRASTSSSQART